MTGNGSVACPLRNGFAVLLSVAALECAARLSAALADPHGAARADEREAMGYMRDLLGHYAITSPMSETDVLAAAEEILRRKLERQGTICSPHDSAAFLRMRLGHLLHEEFHAVWLDTRHQILAVDLLFNGTIDGASIHPREVVRCALRHNAASVIFSHNRPSGNPEPSAAD